MTCLQCGAKEASALKEKYLKTVAEYEDLMIKNKSGHPEPEEQVCEIFNPLVLPSPWSSV